MKRRLKPRPLREFRTWLMMLVALMPAAAALTATAWFQNDRTEATEYAQVSTDSAQATMELFRTVAGAFGTDASIQAAALPGASPEMVAAASADAAAAADTALEASRVVPDSIHLIDPSLVAASLDQLTADTRFMYGSVAALLRSYEPGADLGEIFRASVDLLRAADAGRTVPLRLRDAPEANDHYSFFDLTVRYYGAVDEARAELLNALRENDHTAVTTSLAPSGSRRNDWVHLNHAVMASAQWAEIPSWIGDTPTPTRPFAIDPFTEIGSRYTAPLSIEDRNALLLEIRELDNALAADGRAAFARYDRAAKIHVASLEGASTEQILIITLMGACSVFLGWLTVTEIRHRLNVEVAHAEAVSRLEEKADRDPLTSAWNRRRFERTLPNMLVATAEAEQVMLLAYLDLDSFKAINDVWGHSTGDTVLVTVSNRLDQFRFDDVAFETCRFGGDEFVLCAVTHERSIEWLEELGREIVGAVGAAIPIDDQLHQVHASVGITASTSDSTIESLLLEADSCLILAKKDRGRALVYDRTKSRTGELVYALPAALDAGEVRAHIQPVVDVSTGKIVHVEALARWLRSAGEQVSPAEFIPIVESYGLSEALTSSIMRSVQRILDDPATPPDVRVWINLSPRELDIANFADRLMRLFDSLDIETDRIGIEITETAAIHDHDRLARGLQTLRKAGIEAAIDDFGNGYSPLGYLRHLPITTLKLDRSLISNIDTNHGNQHMVRGIVGLAADLGIEITAEGIERAAEMHWLVDLGVTRMQGFLFARPEDPVGFDWDWASSIIDVREVEPAAQPSPQRPSRTDLLDPHRRCTDPLNTTWDRHVRQVGSVVLGVTSWRREGHRGPDDLRRRHAQELRHLPGR